MTLASLLPGLRDLRAPLAAGYLWLFDLWLLFGTSIPSSKEATGVLKRIYDLEGVLSELGSGIAISFVAYLVGSLSEWGTTAFARQLLAETSMGDFREVQNARAALLSDERSYGEYDRYKAEAEFRLAIFPPLLILVVFAGLEIDWKWVFLAIPIGALAMQGLYLLRQANVILKRQSRLADARRREP